MRRVRCGRKPYSIFAIILLVFVFTVVGLSVGLFVGHRLGKGSSVPIPTAAPTAPPPSPQSKQFNWGDRVRVNGKEVDVFSWIDDVMTEDNIRNNLE